MSVMRLAQNPSDTSFRQICPKPVSDTFQASRTTDIRQPFRRFLICAVRADMNQGSCLQNFSFPSLPSRSEPRDRKVYLKTHTEATRKNPDPKKIPRASFDVLNLCAKFQDHILTGSTLNRGTTRPGTKCAHV